MVKSTSFLRSNDRRCKERIIYERSLTKSIRSFTFSFLYSLFGVKVHAYSSLPGLGKKRNLLFVLCTLLSTFPIYYVFRLQQCEINANSLYTFCRLLICMNTIQSPAAMLFWVVVFVLLFPSLQKSPQSFFYYNYTLLPVAKYFDFFSDDLR